MPTLRTVTTLCYALMEKVEGIVIYLSSMDAVIVMLDVNYCSLDKIVEAFGRNMVNISLRHYATKKSDSFELFRIKRSNHVSLQDDRGGVLGVS